MLHVGRRCTLMASFELKVVGDLKKTKTFFDRMLRGEEYEILDSLAQRGVNALASATPVDSGKTATAWSYELEYGTTNATITWTNDHVTSDGTPITIMLQYGHGTGTGGYVQGVDYINPALRNTFDEIADAVWKVVTK